MVPKIYFPYALGRVSTADVYLEAYQKSRMKLFCENI